VWRYVRPRTRLVGSAAVDRLRAVCEEVDSVNVALRPTRGLSLCAGIGGIDLGLRLALGERYRTVGYVERDAFCAATLVARMEDAALDCAPIWDDLATFDGKPWRGGVDLVSAGFPCQPFSTAGLRLGKADERWLWPAIARVLRDVRPQRYVLLENVPPVIRHGLGDILGTLAELGFAAEWDVFSAAGVGAPHRRRRFFLLGVADGGRERLEGLAPAGPEARPVGRSGGAKVADADGRGREVERGGGVLDRHRAALGVNANRPSEWTPWPPGPSDAEGWEAYLAAGGPLPAVRRGVDGAAPRVVRHRVERLHALGNGVVPLVVAHAFRALAARLGLTA